MKKLLNLITLSIIIGSLSQTSIAAISKKLAWNKGSDYIIHKTNFILQKHLSIEVQGILYLGTNISGACKTLEALARFRGVVYDHATIETPAEIFNGHKLDKNSCAIEKFETAEKSVSLDYVLINDGQTVSAAEPSEQDALLD